MAHRRLKSVVVEFRAQLIDSREITRDAAVWTSATAPGGKPIISRSRHEQMVQLAFLRAFLAWEAFLEESFTLYLAGQKPSKGRTPFRFAFPPTLKDAQEWIVPEGRSFADWTNSQMVSRRAVKYFKMGKPYKTVLDGNQNMLSEANTLRNAIVHQSDHSQLQFEKLVRNKLGAYTSGLTVGGFLSTIVPSVSPPVTFFDDYVDRLDIASTRIVPS